MEKTKINRDIRLSEDKTSYELWVSINDRPYVKVKENLTLDQATIESGYFGYLSLLRDIRSRT
jgi:uncharacterized protein (DUF2461 family)